MQYNQGKKQETRVVAAPGFPNSITISCAYTPHNLCYNAQLFTCVK